MHLVSRLRLRLAPMLGLALVLLAGGVRPARAEGVAPPDRVEVLPVFFVPKGEKAPSAEQSARLMRHLSIARERYRAMLDGRSTFALARAEPLVYRAEQRRKQYRKLPESGAPQFVAELLAHLGATRHDAPWVLFVVFVNPKEDWPSGGGRPLNGGFDAGGGVVVLSSYALDRVPNVQSTIQHELGHAFGLPHVDVYGRDMRANPSIMSYDPSHHTNGFAPSATPGRLLPEDVRGLAWNDAAFPDLDFEPARDLPRGATLAAPVWLGPMTIPGQPDHAIAVETAAPEELGSRASRAVLGRIAESRGPGITFDARSMWHTTAPDSGWVDLTLAFPAPVTLDRFAFHTQHSGRYHAARAVRVEAAGEDGAFREIAAAPLDGKPDAALRFPATTAVRWRVHLRAGDSGKIVVRGLRFFAGRRELFAPYVREAPDPVDVTPASTPAPPRVP